MKSSRLARVSLLAGLVTLLGCPSDPQPPGPPDAGTEWNGDYVKLEETGNWRDTGRRSSCTFVTDGGGGACGDFTSFDLSGCNQASLASAANEGLFMMTLRAESATGAYSFTSASILKLNNDGGTSLLGGRPATETRHGNARYLTTLVTQPDGGTLRNALVTCEAPQAPEFTGCTSLCRNGRLVSRNTYSTERLTWRAGEAEASGLELVSERRVELGFPVEVYVTKGHAYVVSVNMQGRTGGLTVFDVSNTAAPAQVKTVEIPGDSYWNGVWAKGDALYIASSTKGVLVFDISSPAEPRFVRSLPGGAASTHTVFVDGDRLYATLNNAIGIWDITAPLEPVELARYTAPMDTYPHDMFALGNQLYASFADQGFIVADTSDTNAIRTLGSFNFDNHYSHHNAVGTFAGRTIAFMGGEGPGEHLRVLDITDPANIAKIGTFQLRPAVSIHNMLLVDKRLYLSWYQEGVRVLDVSNPTQPRQVAHYNTFRETDPGRGGYYDGAIGIRVPGDGFIYVVDTSRGLLILREQ
jgi:hypothetical protein